MFGSQPSLAAPTPPTGKDRQHLIFWAGTPQELEVYKIFGRLEGPTVMIIGGIQGDEPGGYMSADLYADLALKRGNLIVVPRANFKSVVMSHRGPDGDMNRKFEGDLSSDPDQHTVEVLKSLMAESDLLLNLHDGSGYYRPTWESDLANPNRYGQCVIADTDVYVNPETGATIPLAEYAQKVVDMVNQDIDEPLHKFHFFNTKTGAQDSIYKEQRKSATYYALTNLGIPAFGIETSKNLPSLEEKIYQHNLAVNAFLDIFGLEIEQPRITLEPPQMGYAVISVNEALPLAVADGQTLEVAKGDTLEVVHVGANYDRGLSVKVGSSKNLNDLGKPVAVEKPTTIEVRKDNIKIGRINIGILPDDQADQAPRLLGSNKIRPPKSAQVVESVPNEVGSPADMASTQEPIAATETEKEGEGAVDASRQPPTSQVRGTISKLEDEASLQKAETSPEPDQVTGFAIEVDGRPVEIKPEQEYEITQGSMVKMVDLLTNGQLPANTVMNLKGFVPKSKQYKNDGQDRNFTADTGRDMMPYYSIDQKGQAYELNAENGPEIVAGCVLKLVKPKLASVTLEFNGQTESIEQGHKIFIRPGTKVTIIEVSLADGLELTNPRFTLGGQGFPAKLPQTLEMPPKAVNLAVFNGSVLAGKVLWNPK